MSKCKRDCETSTTALTPVSRGERAISGHDSCVTTHRGHRARPGGAGRVGGGVSALGLDLDAIWPTACSTSLRSTMRPHPLAANAAPRQPTPGGAHRSHACTCNLVRPTPCAHVLGPSHALGRRRPQHRGLGAPDTLGSNSRRAAGSGNAKRRGPSHRGRFGGGR
jgi:hypothetical protein